MNRRFALTGMIAVLMLGIAGLIGWQTDWGRAWRDSSPEIEARKANLDTAVLPAYKLAPLDSDYKQTTERPLFVPTRRPAPAANTSAQVVMKKGQFKLAGTTVSTGVSIAYLVETANNKTHRVNQGGEINGIRVERVDAARVLLKQGDDSEELSLRTAASPKLPPPAQVAAAPIPGQPGQQGQPIQPGQLPGVPGGNFGPPLPQGQAFPQGVPQQVPPQFASGQPVAGAPNAAVAGAPVQQPLPVPGVTPNAGQTDPNAVQMRRRRFQNLPQ